MTGMAYNAFIFESPDFKHLSLYDSTVKNQAPDHRVSVFCTLEPMGFMALDWGIYKTGF